MRTFIAIELPTAVKQRVADQQQTLRRLLAAQGIDGAWRWTPAENLHLTLRFLGETSAGQQRAIEAALAQAGQRGEPFALGLGVLGAFPNLRRPNILWLDFGGEISVLAALQERIERAAREVGFAAEERTFQPHLTIARAQKSASPAQLARSGECLRPLAGVSEKGMPGSTPPDSGAQPFVVQSVHLVASDLRPAGPVYRTLASFALG
jgi:2'-5' RNA ligase